MLAGRERFRGKQQLCTVRTYYLSNRHTRHCLSSTRVRPTHRNHPLSLCFQLGQPAEEVAVVALLLWRLLIYFWPIRAQDAGETLKAGGTC